MTARATQGSPSQFHRAALGWPGGAVAMALSLPVVILMTPFWLVSAATRKVASLLEGSPVEWFDIVEPDDELGWRIRPNLGVRVRDSAGQPFRVTTDVEGWRGSAGIDDADIVVIGDSFAFGHAVDDGEFFPSQVPGWKVKALGAPGYSMVHMLLLTRRIADRLRGKHVVWFVYEGNDLDDSLKPEMDGYRVPFVRPSGAGEWMIEASHLSTDRWRIPSPLLAHEALVEISLPTFLAQRVRDASRFLIDQGSIACQQAGARFSVALVPDISELSTRRIQAALATRPDAERYDAEAPDRLMRDVCASLRVEFLSLREHLTPADYRPDARALEPPRQRECGTGAHRASRSLARTGLIVRTARYHRHTDIPAAALPPQALQSVVAQGYPAIDLIVSDNGENSNEVREIVERHYPGPFQFRRNERTVRVDEHFNQLLAEARGEYFLVLADDDQLGDNFLHGLAAALRDDPAVGVAIARMRVIDEDGREVDPVGSKSEPPARMSAAEFVQMWCRSEYDFVTFLTVMCRTEDLRRTGGYPDFPEHGTSIDDAVVLRLAVGRQVAWVSDAVFRNRVYEASHGLSLPIRELALDLRRYMRFLDRDEALQDYAAREPGEWRGIRALQRQMTWRTYRYRWRHMYRQRLGYAEWARAAFCMPPIPAYYASVLPQVLRAGLSRARPRGRRNEAA